MKLNQPNEKIPDSLRGYFLISESNMNDPNFYRTVVLIIEHNQEGAFGLVVNRKSRLSLSDVIPELRDSHSAQNSALYIGGPVQQEFLFAVHGEMPENHIPSDASSIITNRVIFEPAFSFVKSFYDDSFLDQIPVDDHPGINLYLGYSGWAAGQLEAEMKSGSWIFHPANSRIVFNPNPQQGWKQALKEKGGIYKVFAESDQQPSLN